MGKRQLTAERAAYLKDLGRRKRLKRKVARGSATEEERAELDRYPPVRRGRRGGFEREEYQVPGEERPVSAADVEGSAPPPAPPRIATPPPPPPPRVEILPSGDWRAKYRKGVGREMACLQAATAYCGILVRLTKFVESRGGSPVFGEEEITETILPAVVLSIDKLLPAGFEMSPEVEVAVGSGLIVGQAAIVAMRKKPPRPSSAANGVREPVAPEPATPSPVPAPPPAKGPIKLDKRGLPEGSIL